jgi:Domain of unknown function (DUF4825)
MWRMSPPQSVTGGRASGRTTRCLLALALVVVASLTGCGGPSGEPEELSYAQWLWSHRTAYSGDGSRVAELVRGVGPAPEGSYRIRLRTAKRPYALTIDISRLDKPFDLTDFHLQTTLLLGLVGNLDKVSVTSGAGSYSMTTASSSRELGYDVKELGRDQARLDAYLDASRD